MNDSDADKLFEALSIVVNLETQLTNFISRGGRAGKAWTGWMKSDPPRDAQAVAHMKAAMTALGKMGKDAKLVLKDIDKTAREANQKNLAKYATGKEYRDRVLVKQLASARAWEQNCSKFLTEIGSTVPPFDYPKPSGGAAVDETATVGAIKNYIHYMDEMKKALAKL